MSKIRGSTQIGATGTPSSTTFLRGDDTWATPSGGFYVVLPFSYAGTLAVGTGTFRIYNDTGAARTITAVRASVGTSPAGASVIVDVKKNGTTIFTTTANRPAIAAGSNTSGKVTNMDVTALADGDYLTVDIAQVGSTTAGADLTVAVWLS